MFVIDFRNKLVSNNNFSVMGNNNVDTVYFFSHFVQYASGYNVYLKVISDDETYADKIKIDSENISVEDGALLVKWTMGEVSTQCKKINVQLQFENNDGSIINQTRIVSITLNDTIDVDGTIGHLYPKILEDLQHQIDTLENGSVAGYTMSFNNDTLIINLKNANGDIVATNQVAIPTAESFKAVSNLGNVLEFLQNNGNKQSVIAFKTLDGQGQETFDEVHKGYGNSNWFFCGDYLCQLNHNEGQTTFSTIAIDVKNGWYYKYQGNWDTYKNLSYSGLWDSDLPTIVRRAYLPQTNEHNKVYGTNNSGVQIVLSLDNGSGYTGNVARRDSNGQMHVPQTPTANDHATSKQYVDAVDDKLNANVHIEGGSDEITYVGDTVTKTSPYKNLKTGATGSRSEVIHLADDTHAGMMSHTDYEQIRNNTARIENLEGQTTRLLYTTSQNPTAQQIADFVDAYLATKGIVNPTPEDYAGIAVVVAGTYHIWHYYSNQTPNWVDDGQDTVSQFTNEIAGIILGKNADGFVYAETDGTGSVVGWSALKTRVTDIENNLASYVTIDTQQVITGIKKFVGSIGVQGSSASYPDFTIQSVVNEIGFYYNNYKTYALTNTTFRPVPANVDLGTSTSKWKNGYFSGNVEIDAQPTASNHATPKQYVDDAINTAIYGAINANY